MDMDPAERGGVEWVPEFCPVKGSSSLARSRTAALWRSAARRRLHCCDSRLGVVRPSVPPGGVGRVRHMTLYSMSRIQDDDIRPSAG